MRMHQTGIHWISLIVLLAAAGVLVVVVGVIVAIVTSATKRPGPK